MAGRRVAIDDIEPLLEGLAIMGTGGGGNPEWGRAILANDLARGRELWLVSPGDIPDDALVVSGGLMGSVKTLEGMSIEDLVARWETRFELLVATSLMEDYLGRKVEYVVPFEAGGLNTPAIMSLAARLGIKTVDGDGLGRSAPETHMSSFLGHGISLTPMSLVDTHGNAIVVTDQVAPTFADEIGRWMVTRGGGMGANNHYPMTGKQLKASVIPDTSSLALALGRTIMAARQSGRDPRRAAMAALGGVDLFQGKVTSLRGEDRGGFYITEVVLAGDGPHAGREARMVIKNETMVLWIDGRLRAVFPDLVCMLDPATGAGIMSVDLAVGKGVALLGTACHARLRHAATTPAGRSAFGGARYGHPYLAYAPIEQLGPESGGSPRSGDAHA
ncbi:MAG TPA: DUF917 domain-containing protein [Bacillota bacterium]|nr:DUF917 domain-containing protein [Bacillota bacterium]